MRRKFYLLFARSTAFAIAVAFCSVFVTAFGFSFGPDCQDVSSPVYFLHPDHVSASELASEPASEPASFTDRVLARLEQRECAEADPWRRDDLRIAWNTVLYAGSGEAHPHFWATYNVLRTSPDQVWPMIVARRKSQLGSAYSRFYDANDLWRGDRLSEVEGAPKKPAQSVKPDQIRRRARAAAA